MKKYAITGIALAALIGIAAIAWPALDRKSVV